MIKKFISAALISTVIISSGSVFAADVNLTDIDSSHWAYSAISELVSNGTVNGYPDGTFKPNGKVTYAEFEKMITGEWKNNPTPIDREAALEMLWKYSGSPANYTAPAIIKNQMVNKEAVAWGYSTGLMQGNDGLNLRPDDTLSRAEAATLIVRSKGTIEGDHSFAVSVDDAIAKEVWNAYGIFTSEYKADETVSPEELSVAVADLGDFRPGSIAVETTTMDDVTTLLSYALVSSSKTTVSVSKAESKTATDKYGTLAQLHGSYAYASGIELPKDKTAAATKRDVALILMQLDDLIGRSGAKVNKEVAAYPENHADFAYLQEGVPYKAYTTPYDIDAKAVEFFDFVNNYKLIFDNFVKSMETEKCNGKAKFTLIPSLVAQDDTKEAVVRVKCELTGNATASELFGEGYESAGKEFYMDLHTGEPVLDFIIPTDIAKIGKFVCNQ